MAAWVIMADYGESLLQRMRRGRENQLEALRQKYGFDFRFGFPDGTVETHYRYMLMYARDCPLVYAQERSSKPQPRRRRTC